MADEESTEFIAEENRVEERSNVFKKELGLTDLVFTQILFIVGLPWVGGAAKHGPSRAFLWLIAAILFYVPSAFVVIYLNRAMPLEGGLYQWAKLGFNELTGFLVAWNLWLFAILNTSEIGLQITQYFHYVLGPRGAALAANSGVVAAVNVMILTGLVIVTIRGLSIGKWVHKAGGVLMLTTFAMLIALPWVNLAHGSLREFHALVMTTPLMTVLSFNIAAKMGFGALGGFEYVAIHA